MGRVWTLKAPGAHRVVAVAKRKVREAESEAGPGPATISPLPVGKVSVGGWPVADPRSSLVEGFSQT